jgi:hypothetical protein
MSNIRKSVAVLLCTKIRHENGCKWYTPSGLTCRLCMRSSKGNPLKMKMRKGKAYNGCRLVNDWYAKLTGSKGKEKLNKRK